MTKIDFMVGMVAGVVIGVTFMLWVILHLNSDLKTLARDCAIKHNVEHCIVVFIPERLDYDESI